MMPPFDEQRLLSLLWLRGVLPSPCGRWLIVEASRPRAGAGSLTHLRGLWRLSLDDRSVPAEPLAVGPWNAHTPAYRSDGALGYLCDAAPGGSPQVWLLPAGGEPAYALTAMAGGVQSFRFAYAADRLVMLVSPEPVDARRPLSYTDLPIRDHRGWLAPRGPHFFAAGGDGAQPIDLTPRAAIEYRDADWDLSPDGEWLATTCLEPGGARCLDAPLVVLSARDGEARARWADPGFTYEMPRFSPDGGRLASRRHQRRPGMVGRPLLVVHELSGPSSPHVEPVMTHDGLDWPRIEGWTPDGRRLLVTAPCDGDTPIFSVPADERAAPMYRVTHPDAGGSHEGVRVLASAPGVCGLRHRICHPPEAFRCDLEAHSHPALIAELAGFSELEGNRMVRWEARRTTGPGGAAVSYLVVWPQAIAPPYPVVLWIHGGPIGAASDAWNWRWNPLLVAARGYAVVMPNPRGSLGFGQAFVEGAWNNAWGDTCLADVQAVLDDVVGLEAVDPSRIGAWGGSFGGYMCNLLATVEPRLRCVMSHAGPFQLSALHGESDIPAWRTWEMGCDPCEAPARYDRHSPHLRVARWRVPALITHGSEDARVPPAQSQRLFEALRSRGVDAELVIFPREGHQLADFEQLADWYRRVIRFFGCHLLADREACT